MDDADFEHVMNDPEVKLIYLRGMVTELVLWAQHGLAADRDPQLIAEHLAEALDALINDVPPPAAPML